MAVNLKSIDASNVTLSYAYSDTKLDNVTSSNSIFEAQRISTHGTKYIYIVVTPTGEIPTTFQSSIVWYQGRAGTVDIKANGETISSQTVVKGQEISQLLTPTKEGYYFDAWFTDETYSEFATFPVRYKEGQSFNARFANLPSDWLELDSTTDTYYVKRGTTALPNNLVIPSIYNGKQVTRIKEGHFNMAPIDNPASGYAEGVFSEKSITSVDLPVTMTRIGNYAFSYCYALVEVYNRSSLDIVVGASSHGSVAYYAGIVLNGPKDESKFVTIDGVDYYKNSETDYMALGLSDKTKTSITLDSRTTSIRNYGFYDCDSLTSVDLSNCIGITQLNGTFMSCSSLTNITLPNSITELDDTFRSCSSLKSINMSACANLTTIGSWTFFECMDLTSVDLGGCTNLTTIGTSPFYNCSKLTDMNVSGTKISSFGFVPSSVQNLNASGCANLTTIKAGAFMDYSALTSINLSGCDGLTTIDSDAFRSVTNLNHIDLSNCTNLTTIGASAFRSDAKLVDVDLSTCTALTTIDDYAFRYCSKLKVAKLPSNLETIGAEAFRYCGDLKYIELPNTLTTIESNAFNGCYDLAEVYNRSSLNVTIASTGNGYLAYYASVLKTTARDESKLTTINGVDYYKNSDTDYMALRLDDKTKTSLTLDSRTTSIGDYAFCKNTTLTSVDLAGCTNLATIRQAAFAQSSKITKITLPSSVTNIDAQVFYMCTGLTGITIPSAVSSIGKKAFYECSNLNNITFTNTDYCWTSNSDFIDMYNPTSNATYFKTTYVNYAWSKSGTPIKTPYIGSVKYTTIEEALTASVSGDVIVVPAMGREVVGLRYGVIRSDCTIKSGVTLLLAYDSEGTRVTNVAIHESGTLFDKIDGTRTSLIRLYNDLTIENGGTLEIAGQLTCGRVISNYTGHTGGKYAEMAIGAECQIISNGIIKCTGYITKADADVSGQIILNSGSELYLPFILNDYRGGSYMYAAYNKNVAPFTQYELANIATYTEIKYGCKVIGYANAEMDDEIQSININLVGTTTDYIYQLTNSNSYITMWSEDEITTLNFYNGMSLNPLKMDVKITISMTMTSEKFHLPIPWTFDIRLFSGTYDFTVQDIKLFPGAKLSIYSGATLTADDIVVYDSTFKDTSHLTAVRYPTDKGDAQLIIHGELVCSRLAGPARSTTDGAKITINNSGASDFNSVETNGSLGGLGGILSTIETKTITHTTKLWWGTGTSDYVTHTYTANTPVTYTRTSSGWEIS
ncbi:MAG: leucine-rich repeat protein [Clostridia bacterium]|nr:leucine-rich repeat protein [Clostridia bacterium]